MSTTIAALFAALIITGMTSAVSHDFTAIGGSTICVMLACTSLVSRNAIVYPAFLFGAFAMSAIALVSSEANVAPFSSTIHVVSCYVALMGFGFASPGMSTFCRRVMMYSNLLLTAWILYQGFGVKELRAWQISNPSGNANLMAAQINMTLPLILRQIHERKSTEKLLLVILLSLNCVAVFLVMSRSGIGGMLIILTLYVLFNYKRWALLAGGAIAGIFVSLDSIIQIPLIHNLLVSFRVVGFKPVAPRSLIWDIAFDHISRRPLLGVGPGQPRKMLAVIDIYHAHNNFIQIALETGIPTALIFTFLVILLLWLCGRTVFGTRNEFLATLPILAYLSYSWTGTPLAYPGATLLLAVCVHEARMVVRNQEQSAWARQPSPNVVVGKHLARGLKGVMR